MSPLSRAAGPAPAEAAAMRWCDRTPAILALARRAEAGARLSHPEAVALMAHQAAESAPSVAAWIANTIGTEWAPLKALGIGAARVLRDGAMFQASGHLSDADGTPAIIVPVEEFGAVVDALAFDPADPQRVASLSGVLPVLGLHMAGAAEALEHGAPVAIVRDARSWCRHASEHGPMLDGAPCVCVLDWQSPDLADLLAVPGARIVAEDDEHARQLKARIDAWRRPRCPPRPTLLVADA